jgi:hypothetical protein
VLAIKSKKRFIQGYREFLLVGAILLNFSNIACVSAKNGGVTTGTENDVDQLKNLASFDADKFALSGCDDTLLRDMKNKNVVPKRIKYDDRIAAYKYQNSSGMIFIPKHLDPHNNTGFVLFSSIVTNLKAYDFTKPFYGKTLSEVEGFLASNLDGSKFDYTINPSQKSITMHTEGTDIEFYSNKGGIYRVDFQCDSHG